MQKKLEEMIDPNTLNTKVSDLDEETVLKGFIGMAQIGIQTKDEIQSKRDELEARIEELNSDDADIHQMLMEDKENKELKTRLHELNVERNKLQHYIDQLEEALVNYKNFDKSLFFSNVRYLLARNTELKVGQIEREANVRLGYTARLEKPDNTSEPSMEYICSASKILGTSIDVITSIDLQAMTPTEKYLSEFVDKLKIDTLKDKLNWNKETADELNRADCDMNGNVYHPLLSVETFMEESETEYPDEITRVTFVSHSFGPNTWINGDCYNLRLKNGTYVYLMDICKSVHKLGDSSAYVKEVWMYSAHSGAQFMFASNDVGPLSNVVEPLFEIVRESCRHPRLNNEFKSAIEAFMTDDISDDEDFMDPELPFK